MRVLCLDQQVTQVICGSGLCIQGVGINYHNRNLVVALDAKSLLDVHVDGVEQGRGVTQSLDPTSVTGCPLTVTWTKDTSLVVSARVNWDQDMSVGGGAT